MSSFFGINVATQGLYTARIGLDVTNHNITNAETVGYSRQIAEQQASRALPTYMGKGMIGTGSEVTGINQLRNEYYDIKYWSVNQYYGQYSSKYSNLQQIETIFNDPTDTGFNTLFNDLFEQLQTLSTNPSDDAYRVNFRESAVSFTSLFNTMDEQLRNTQRDLNFSIKTKVEEINYIAEQLANINKQISTIEIKGVKANDLRDERANLVDKLSEIINVDVKEINEGNNVNRYTVYINGQSLVDGNECNQLELIPRDSLDNPEDEPDLYDIYWASGQKFYTNSPTLNGELKGLLDLRDGNNGDNFTGEVLSSVGTTLTVENVNRSDLPDAGEIMIGNQAVKYTSYTYDEVNNTIEFQLDTAMAVAVGTDVEMGVEMEYKGIPYYISKLNEFVRTFAEKVNEIHEKGEYAEGQTGQKLFAYTGYTGGVIDYNDITAGNFSLDQAIIDDFNRIATTMDLSDGVENNEILTEILNLKNDVSMFNQGKPESYMQAVLSEIAIDTNQAQGMEEGQVNMLLSIENQRLSYSGVDLNEETMNMLQYQYAYNLAAKMISVMDEIYDVTINSMGV